MVAHNCTLINNTLEESPLLIYRQVVGSIIFVAIWPLIVFDFSKYFPIGRPASALLGGTLMVLFYVLEQADVYRVVGGSAGDRGPLRTLFLLMGMMLLAFYFDRIGVLRWIAVKVFGRQDASFRSILWRVCAVSGLLSALITNDAACVVLTPIILREHHRQKRHKRELYFLCLAVATSANIGSAATIFGNPQNAFIASSAQVSLLQFLISLTPAAIIGLVINTGLLYLYYEIRFKCAGHWCLKRTRRNSETQTIPGPTIKSGNSVDSNSEDSGHAELEASRIPPMSLPNEREIRQRSRNANGDRVGISWLALERDILQGGMDLSQTWEIRTGMSRSLPNLPPGTGYGSIANGETGESLTATTVLDEEMQQPLQEDLERANIDQEQPSKKPKKWKKYLFATALFTVAALVIILLVIPIQLFAGNFTFDLGLVPFGGAVLVMLIDSIVNRRSAYDAMVQIDWTLILLFIGLFVWLEGVQQTCFPSLLLQKLEDSMKVCQSGSVGPILLFSALILVGSNLISNVPLTILIVGKLGQLGEGCGGVDEGSQAVIPAMLLAWVATVAGNFTLIGSIANLLVAEKAKLSEQKYIFGFFSYLIFGAVSTTIVTFVGLPIVFGCAKVALLIPA